MIDVQKYIDKLEKLKWWVEAYVELKCWMEQPLKPFPYDYANRIWTINKNNNQ